MTAIACKMGDTPNVLLWTPFSKHGDRLAAVLGDVGRIRLQHARSEEEAVAMMPLADFALISAIGGGYTAAVAQAVHTAPRLRWIQILSTGMDEIEVHGVPEKIEVSGIGNSGAPVVAEHAMALLLALVRQVPQAVNDTRQGRWDRGGFTALRSIEGMRLGVVGCGSIGQAVARRAVAFGARCVGFNSSGRNPAPDAIEFAVPMVKRVRALQSCDALVFSLPATPATHGLFGTSAWSACKPGVYVVNVGRGAVIDTDSLCDALESGQVGGAGLDVTEPEPLPPGHRLWSAPNVIVTPHLAGAGSQTSMERLCELVVSNMVARTEQR